MSNMNIAAAWVSESGFNQVVTEPLHNHIALSRSHWFFIDTKDQSLGGLLDGNTTSSLQWKQKQHQFIKKQVAGETKVHQTQKTIEISSYLFSSNDGIWLSLDYHVLVATEEQSCWGKCSRFSKIFVDAFDFFGLQL